MKLQVKKPSYNLLLIFLLLGALIALARLQYRWIGEISENERERMRRNAQVSAENFSREFDRELTRAYLQLQVDSISLEKRNWENYALRYENWLATTPYPKLVKRVAVAARDEHGKVVLSVFNEETRSFEPSAWSAQLAYVQRKVEQDLSGENQDENPNENRREIWQNRRALEIVAADVPALVIPISAVNLLDLQNVQMAAARTDASFFKPLRQVGYTILLLDFDYIKNELLPLLVARYFNFAGESDNSSYNVVVTSRAAAPQILYQSSLLPTGSNFADEDKLLKGDVEQSLFKLRFDEIKSLLPAAPRRGSAILPKPASEESKRQVSINVITARSNTIDSTVSAASLNVQEARWQLLVRHQTGSFEAAVETMRQRNLLISFSILLLLAASGIMLLVLTDRKQRFARQQTDFVASITHELRTPLAVIRSASENLVDGIITDAAQVKRYGALINEEERRLSRMVEQVLEIASAQTMQNYCYEFGQHTAHEIIEAALGDYELELKKHDFDVVLKFEPDLPSLIADKEALQSAFGNLIANAVKYSGETRRIEISARKCSVESLIQVEILVKDCGAGIEKRDLQHIFKLFYRGQAASENQIKGSGIGLSLVKQTVEAHHGTISVISAPGQGSTFKLRLPAAV